MLAGLLLGRFWSAFVPTRSYSPVSFFPAHTGLNGSALLRQMLCFFGCPSLLLSCRRASSACAHSLCLKAWAGPGCGCPVFFTSLLILSPPPIAILFSVCMADGRRYASGHLRGSGCPTRYFNDFSVVSCPQPHFPEGRFIPNESPGIQGDFFAIRPCSLLSACVSRMVSCGARLEETKGRLVNLSAHQGSFLPSSRIAPCLPELLLHVGQGGPDFWLHLLGAMSVPSFDQGRLCIDSMSFNIPPLPYFCRGIDSLLTNALSLPRPFLPCFPLSHPPVFVCPWASYGAPDTLRGAG